MFSKKGPSFLKELARPSPLTSNPIHSGFEHPCHTDRRGTSDPNLSAPSILAQRTGVNGNPPWPLIPATIETIRVWTSPWPGRHGGIKLRPGQVSGEMPCTVGISFHQEEVIYTRIYNIM